MCRWEGESIRGKREKRGGERTGKVLLVINLKTLIYLAKGFFLASCLLVVVTCILICLALTLYTAFERMHLAPKVAEWPCW